ncbi:acidic mammalian chitinase-like [Musca autumnalis]|uniref:acidic mammalian chitinase-like n=1 Tax=Musca autumnalis TaxID=221902 RepID=UPI003CEE92E0
MKSLRTLIIFCCLLQPAFICHAKIINCYFGTWANYRPGLGRFEPENINPDLCTHLSYSFFGITELGEFRMLDSWLDVYLNFIKRTMALKTSNPNLKVMAAVGGWNEGSIKYSQMAADPLKRKTFIQTSLDFISQHGFDGLDLDWEYPGQRGGSADDKQNFVLLLKELKESLGPLDLELSIAVGASAYTASLSYDIPNIAKYVDFINVMTYDLGMASDGVLGFNAPLRGQGENNVENCISYWLENGAPTSKLILGLAFYGRTFQLSNAALTTPGSRCSGAGAAGPYTQESGFMGYNEICTLQPSWSTVYDVAHGAPYMYKDNQWISYDNVQSLDEKMEFMNSLDLGGVMLWSIETDDFHGECGEKFPLLNAINRKIYTGYTNSSQVPTSTTIATTTAKTTNKPEVTSTSTTNAPSSTVVCASEGYFTHETDCNRFYQCIGGRRYDFSCPPDLYFDLNTMACNWASLANCGY